MKCPRCKAENFDDANVCSLCGVVLATGVNPAAGPPNNSIPGPDPDPIDIPAPVGTPQKKSRTVAIVTAFALTTLLVAAATYPIWSVLWMNHKSTVAQEQGSQILKALAMYGADNDDCAPYFADAKQVTDRINPYFSKLPSGSYSPSALASYSNSLEWNTHVSTAQVDNLLGINWIFYDPDRYGDLRLVAVSVEKCGLYTEDDFRMMFGDHR